jgi:hypothetical protein
MKKLGQILVADGVVTAEELRRAVELSERRGVRLATALAELGFAAPEAIDRAWVNAVVTPALAGAIDRACGNAFSRQPDRAIEYRRVHRKDVVIEDMMRGGALVSHEEQIVGAARLRVGGAWSLEFLFELDTGTGFAMLEDRADRMIERWMDLVRRGVAAGAKEATGEGTSDAAADAA